MKVKDLNELFHDVFSLTVHFPSFCILTSGLCFEQTHQLCVRLCTGLTQTHTQVSFPNFREVH